MRDVEMMTVSAQGARVAYGRLAIEKDQREEKLLARVARKPAVAAASAAHLEGRPSVTAEMTVECHGVQAVPLRFAPRPLPLPHHRCGGAVVTLRNQRERLPALVPRSWWKTCRFPRRKQPKEKDCLIRMWRDGLTKMWGGGLTKMWRDGLRGIGVQLEMREDVLTRKSFQTRIPCHLYLAKWLRLDRRVLPKLLATLLLRRLPLRLPRAAPSPSPRLRPTPRLLLMIQRVSTATNTVMRRLRQLLRRRLLLRKLPDE
mmetsp:Transcript_44644/g.69623  ORF Transcript_44644/g.69623 Transcript_44644/m.69623 type:complete len:258 (+) Transcript_44644:599-1372(+)